MPRYYYYCAGAGLSLSDIHEMTLYERRSDVPEDEPGPRPIRRDLIDESRTNLSNDTADDEIDYLTFSNEHWQTRVNLIESGDVDHLLTEIVEQTSSNSVREAAEARRE